jgi:hypothetical protein
MSLLAEDLISMTVKRATTLHPKHMYALLGVPISTRRLKCALLPLLALRNALQVRGKKPLLTWTELTEEDLE